MSLVLRKCQKGEEITWNSIFFQIEKKLTHVHIHLQNTETIRQVFIFVYSEMYFIIEY